MRPVWDHILLGLAVLVFCGPVAWVLSSALMPSAIGDNWQTLSSQLAAEAHGPELDRMIVITFALAASVSILTTVLSFLAAYVFVFFRGTLLPAGFWLAVLTLYFPVEARMLQTFDVVVQLGLTSSLTGLALPVLQLGLGTLFFRQHFKRLPRELFEAAQLDAAGALRCLLQIALPLSWRAAAAVALIAFITGWNQYLWPLMASVDDQHWTLVRGLERVQAASGAGLLLAAMSLLPPLVLVLLFRRLRFVPD